MEEDVEVGGEDEAVTLRTAPDGPVEELANVMVQQYRPKGGDLMAQFAPSALALEGSALDATVDVEQRTESSGNHPADAELSERVDKIRKGTSVEADRLTESLRNAEQALIALRLGLGVRVVLGYFGDPHELDTEVEYLSFGRWHGKWQLRIQRELQDGNDPEWIADDHVTDASLERRQVAANHLNGLVDELLAAAERRVESLQSDRAKVDGVVERLTSLATTKKKTRQS